MCILEGNRSTLGDKLMNVVGNCGKDTDIYKLVLNVSGDNGDNILYCKLGN